MIDLFAQKATSDPETIARVKGWVRQIMGLSEDVTILVTELRCLEDDCPDIETVVAILGENGLSRKHRVMKAVAEITRDDVMSLATTITTDKSHPSTENNDVRHD